MTLSLEEAKEIAAKIKRADISYVSAADQLANFALSLISVRTRMHSDEKTTKSEGLHCCALHGVEKNVIIHLVKWDCKCGCHG